MRLSRFCVLVFFLILVSPLCAENEITVSKVKIIIQKSEYLWSLTGDVELVSDCDSYISPYTVISYSSMYPGKTMSNSAFENEIARTQLRLEESGLFYSVMVQVVPPRKKPELRTVVITLTEGFFHRFSGGNAYGMYGRQALGGERAGITGFAGWNLFGIEYHHKNLFNRNYIFNGEVYSYDLLPSLFNKDDFSSTTELSLFTGKYITPDTTIGFLSGIWAEHKSTESFSDTFMYVGPCIKISRLEFIPFDFYWNMKSSYSWFFNQSSYKVQTNWAAHKDFAQSYFSTKDQKLELAVLASAGYQNNTDEDSLVFDLYTVCDISINDVCVRSGYERSDLLALRYALFSSELRFDILSIKIPPAFTCIPQVFIFADFALLTPTIDSSLVRSANAFGGGLRLQFANPIFAYFTFCGGFNNEGNGRFVFSATKGF
jgi:hypothetical protein